MKKLLHFAGKKESELKNIDKTFFPAGDMFWFRGRAIKPIVDMDLSAQEFEIEQGQVDGTLAHAIERMFPYFGSIAGMSSKSYLSDSFFSQESSSQKIELLRNYLSRDLIINPTIIFDNYNSSGGSNVYSRELVKEINTFGNSALRVYCFESIYFIQWIGVGDGMLFCSLSIEEVFDVLSTSKGGSIILNSLYGYPDIKEVVSKIIELQSALKATLDFKIHDFHALCPSPHLSNFEGKYCGVPENLRDCSSCLKKNLSWYHDWYPKGNIPLDVALWRKPFSDLFSVSSTITVFDLSTINILKKAFKLDDGKIKVKPHSIKYFKSERIEIKGSLHIGILGTLSLIKGGDVVRELGNYICQEGLGIPITVVGLSSMELPKSINIHGRYHQNDLPEIVNHGSINLILMPSIVPETFSYTISEAMQMGLPIVAFDIGAQGSRVRSYPLGKIIPLGSSPKVILEAAHCALQVAQEFKK